MKTGGSTTAAAHAQVQEKKQAQAQAHAQGQAYVHEKTQAQVQAEQGNAVAGDSSGDEEQTEKLQELQQRVDEVAQMAATKNGEYEATTEAEGFARLYDE